MNALSFVLFFSYRLMNLALKSLSLSFFMFLNSTYYSAIGATIIITRIIEDKATDLLPKSEGLLCKD